MAPRHPYVGLPDYQFWDQQPGSEGGPFFDPVVEVSFGIDLDEPVVTAGSCFAQTLAHALKRSGFNLLVTEKPHPLLTVDLLQDHHYGLFSARYGNIYTTRQLKQLLQRAYGLFEPRETQWEGRSGWLVDPFRPQIQPDGFINAADLEKSRETHLAAVRQAVEQLSLFVFTLGLTEAWVDRRDGAVFPLAPGVAGGVYDETRFAFVNFDFASVVADLQWSLDFIRAKNPASKFVLTVSPVQIKATYEKRHVSVASSYSKSLLRVAADAVSRANRRCDYFPSYEMVTSSLSQGRTYRGDRRTVRGDVVRHVISIFMKHYAGIELPKPANAAAAARKGRNSNDSGQAGKKQRRANTRGDKHLKEMGEALDVLCDEESITDH
ncbi:MAG: GSCFA domain-containing protein [Pseudomonadota bacterium]